MGAAIFRGTKVRTSTVEDLSVNMERYHSTTEKGFHKFTVLCDTERNALRKAGWNVILHMKLILKITLV